MFDKPTTREITKNMQAAAAIMVQLFCLSSSGRFLGALGQEYPKISRSWRDNWANLKFPQEVQRLIYTTNTIERFRAPNKICKEVKRSERYGKIKDMTFPFAGRSVQPGISSTGLPGEGLRVPLTWENTVGLSSAPLSGFIDTGIYSFAMSAGPIFIWL